MKTSVVFSSLLALASIVFAPIHANAVENVTLANPKASTALKPTTQTPSTTDAKPQTAPEEKALSPTEKLLADPVATPADLDKLWDAYYSSKDPRFVHKVINTYQTVANDKRFNLEDLLYVASLPQRKSHDNNPKLTSILQHYKQEAILEPFLVGAAALWSLGANATQHAEIKQIINQFLNTNSDRTVTATLGKMMFRTSMAKVRVDPNIIFFTTDDADYVKKYMTPFTPEKMYEGLKNEFSESQSPYMVVAFPLGAKEKMRLSVTVKEPNGKVVMDSASEYTGKDIQPHMATIETAIIPLKMQAPRSAGVYQVTVSMTKNSEPSKQLSYSFFVD